MTEPQRALMRRSSSKKKTKCQPLRTLIPKKDEEPLDQWHTHVAKVQIKIVVPDILHLPRTSCLIISLISDTVFFIFLQYLFFCFTDYFVIIS